jgi:hypothetical protein
MRANRNPGQISQHFHRQQEYDFLISKVRSHSMRINLSRLCTCFEPWKPEEIAFYNADIFRRR